MLTTEQLRKQTTNQKGYNLRHIIANFLNGEILNKAPEDRTKREELLVESGKAFITQLDAYEKRPDVVDRGDEELAPVLSSYNELHRKYDLRNLDAEVIDRFRKQ